MTTEREERRTVSTHQVISISAILATITSTKSTTSTSTAPHQHIPLCGMPSPPGPAGVLGQQQEGSPGQEEARGGQQLALCHVSASRGQGGGRHPSLVVAGSSTAGKGERVVEGVKYLERELHTLHRSNLKKH